MSQHLPHRGAVVSEPAFVSGPSPFCDYEERVGKMLMREGEDCRTRELPNIINPVLIDTVRA